MTVDLQRGRLITMLISSLGDFSWFVPPCRHLPAARTPDHTVPTGCSIELVLNPLLYVRFLSAPVLGSADHSASWCVSHKAWNASRCGDVNMSLAFSAL